MANIAEEKGWSWPFDANVYMGGPVNQHALVMVHSADWWSTNTMPISDTVSISSDNFMTEKMVMGNAPLDWRLCHGIAAWRNGQLEAEIARNDWLVAWPTAEILWSHSGEDQWHKSIELCANQAVETFF